MSLRAAAAALGASTALLAAGAAAAQPPPAPGPTGAGAEVVRTEPAAYVPPAAAKTTQAGSPLVGWAALGLSGLAVLLGGGALGVILADRGRTREAQGASRPPAAATDPRTVERLDRLEAAMRALAAASPPAQPAPGPPAGRDPFPPSPSRASVARPDIAPREAPTPQVAPASRGGPPETLAAWADELTQAFARLARDPPAAAAGFIARHRPRGAVAAPEGVALADGFEGAKLWAVRAPGEGEVWALTPGEAAVMNWSAHFASQRTQVAAEVFGEAFDLVDGGGEGLRMEAPALVRRDDSGRLSVRRRGRLSGFRA